MTEEILNKKLEKIKSFHKKRMNDSFEEKLKILVKLQELDLAMKKSSNHEIKPYEKVWKL